MLRFLVATAALIVGLQGCKREPTRRDPAAAGPDPWADTVAKAGDPAAKRITRPFLWQADKDGVTTWLFGAVHMGVNAETQLPGYVLERIATAKTFVMEADTADPGLALAMQRADGGSLRADLGPEHWKKLEDEIGAGGAERFDGLKPFMVLAVLAAKDLPLTPPMDAALADRARAAERPIHYLELAADQLAMVDPWINAADIKALLDNRELARSLSGQLIDAYRAGDDQALAAMFDEQTLWLAAGRKPETFPAYLDAVLGKRNRAWIPQLERLHAAGGAFVAVGVGHLVGPSNVLGLLAERGFTITRVTAP